jgi:MOB kinase activator 1
LIQRPIDWQHPSILPLASMLILFAPLQTWIEGLINNETLFPPSTAVPFPKDFRSNVKNIFKRLFRVYAHVYIEHFPQIIELKAEAHLNTW